MQEPDVGNQNCVLIRTIHPLLVCMLEITHVKVQYYVVVRGAGGHQGTMVH